MTENLDLRPRRRAHAVKGALRRRGRAFVVYVNDQEREGIMANAAAFRMTVSTYLRIVGTSAYLPKQPPDLKVIEQLAEISAAQTRLARALKGQPDASDILVQIAVAQDRLSAILSKIGQA